MVVEARLPPPWHRGKSADGGEDLCLFLAWHQGAGGQERTVREWRALARQPWQKRCAHERTTGMLSTSMQMEHE